MCHGSSSTQPAPDCLFLLPKICHWMFLNIKQIAWNSNPLRLWQIGTDTTFSALICVFAVRCSLIFTVFSTYRPSYSLLPCLPRGGGRSGLTWNDVRAFHARSRESRQHQHKPHLTHAAGRRGSRLQHSATPVNSGRGRLRLRGAPHIFIIPRVSAWVLEFQVCLERIPHGEAAAAEVEILMRWVFTSSKRKPQSLNPLLDLKSSSIGDSVHRPYDFRTFLFPEPPTEENALLDNLVFKSTWGPTLQGRERAKVRLKLQLRTGGVKNMNGFWKNSNNK